ncbi:BANP [Bugula neritina]|uniref:Protein BANP n=1 Tax=Bugula neritina TaxID=10212 RepID=A0A7J7J1U6_BUGNE|nr:BANP [Bugula neritina]
MADSHLEPPSSGCVSSLFVDVHDPLHQNPVEEHVAAGIVQAELDSAAHDAIEPSPKRVKSEEDAFTETITIDWGDENVKQTLYNVNRALTLRLEDLEHKYAVLLNMLHNQNKRFELQAKEDKSSGNRGRGSAVVVGLPQGNGAQVKNAFTTPGGNVTLITLNNEDDYPSGVWLGDETNPELRVRVPITPSDLLHIHSNCRTPEKMALTLLDYLFDREIQATSNLSGTGKHGKKQLDPLKIYGIRCHLIHKFNIREQDWHRIRLNIDSKCRTAHRRKMRGQPMIVKNFKDSGKDEEFVTYTTTALHDENVLPVHGIQEALTIGDNSELQIIHATEEQLLKLQQSHQIQILDDNQVSAELLQQFQGPNRVISVSVAPSVDDPPPVTSDVIEYEDHSSQLQVIEPEIQHSSDSTSHGL